MSYTILFQAFINGLIMSCLYALMAMGLTFIYSIMKMINWAMGEFYMLGSYIQYFLVISFLGVNYWVLGLPISMIIVFIVGVIFYEGLIKPMFVKGIERKDEYATIITITFGMVIMRNLASLIAGPYYYSTPDYLHPIQLGLIRISGNRIVALIGSVIGLGAFYLFIKKSWQGRAFRAVAQNRIGALLSGVNVLHVDRIGFGLGVALSALAGALLLPEFTAHPECGVMATVKGFEIIVIGGIGSIPGAVIASFVLGLAESLFSVIFSASYRDVYGFIALIIILLLRPRGIMGEKEREA